MSPDRVGGSFITAYGVGSIKLHVSKGPNLPAGILILNNIFYLPKATVHLISVGALNQDLKTHSGFGASDVIIYDAATKETIVTGTQTPSHLFAINLTTAHSECICQGTPSKTHPYHEV